MISSFFSITFILIGVAFITVIKLYSFVLWRVVPIVGLLYIGMAVAEAEENPYVQFAPHLLVKITVDGMEELAIYNTRKLCVARGRLMDPERRGSDYLGFVCEHVPCPPPPPEPEKVSAVCHEEVRHCA